MSDGTMLRERVQSATPNSRRARVMLPCTAMRSASSRNCHRASAIPATILSHPDDIDMTAVGRNPARACGIADRGDIGAGLRADLVRVREVFARDRRAA
jgi:N-acyl-D-aspartate/D-glutamate deacylase